MHPIPVLALLALLSGVVIFVFLASQSLKMSKIAKDSNSQLYIEWSDKHPRWLRFISYAFPFLALAFASQAIILLYSIYYLFVK